MLFCWLAMDPLVAVSRELQRRKYSPQTIRTYCHCLGAFLQWTKKSPGQISKTDVKLYLQHLCDHKKAASTLNVNLQAIKFYLENVLRKRFYVELPYSKVPQRLPVVLSREEVKGLLAAISNPKQRLLVSLIYGAGLRVSEACNLKAGDLEDDHGWVRKGKGGKDRLFIVPACLRRQLEDLTKSLVPTDLIFPGLNGPYSPRSVGEIVKSVCKKAGIKKKVHPHTLRHSFATHLIEDGCCLISVQALLGHASPETSMVYVHLAKPKLLDVKSPLDNLKNSPQHL